MNIILDKGKVVFFLIKNFLGKFSKRTARETEEENKNNQE